MGDSQQRKNEEIGHDQNNTAVDQFLDLLARLIAREHLRRSADGQTLSGKEATKKLGSK